LNHFFSSVDPSCLLNGSLASRYAVTNEPTFQKVLSFPADLLSQSLNRLPSAIQSVRWLEMSLWLENVHYEFISSFVYKLETNYSSFDLLYIF